MLKKGRNFRKEVIIGLVALVLIVAGAGVGATWHARPGRHPEAPQAGHQADVPLTYRDLRFDPRRRSRSTLGGTDRNDGRAVLCRRV